MMLDFIEASICEFFLLWSCTFVDHLLFLFVCVGDSLAILRAELKSQRKHVKNLKKKSLWSKILEEVASQCCFIISLILEFK